MRGSFGRNQLALSLRIGVIPAVIVTKLEQELGMNLGTEPGLQTIASKLGNRLIHLALRQEAPRSTRYVPCTGYANG